MLQYDDYGDADIPFVSNQENHVFEGVLFSVQEPLTVWVSK